MGLFDKLKRKLTAEQKAELAEKLGKLGQNAVKAAGSGSSNNKQQNGNLSGCGGCTHKGK